MKYHLVLLDDDTWIRPDNVVAVIPVRRHNGARVWLASGNMIDTNLTSREVVDRLQEARKK